MAVEIGDLDTEIGELRQQIEASEKTVNEFISQIKDPVLKVGTRLRFVHGATWDEAADIVGLEGSALKIRFSRYMAKHGGE